MHEYNTYWFLRRGELSWSWSTRCSLGARRNFHFRRLDAGETKVSSSRPCAAQGEDLETTSAGGFNDTLIFNIVLNNNLLDILISFSFDIVLWMSFEKNPAVFSYELLSPRGCCLHFFLKLKRPSGNLLHSYWTCPLVVSFTIKNCDFP